MDESGEAAATPGLAERRPPPGLRDRLAAGASAPHTVLPGDSRRPRTSQLEGGLQPSCGRTG